MSQRSGSRLLSLARQALQSQHQAAQRAPSLVVEEGLPAYAVALRTYLRGAVPVCRVSLPQGALLRCGTSSSPASAGLRRLGDRNGAIGSQLNNIFSLQGLRRTYYRDSRGYEHFEGRGTGYGGLQSFLSSGRTHLVLATLGVSWVAYYFYCLETIPYTHRRHSIMLVSEHNEKVMGQMVFNEQKTLAQAQHKLLPPNHPAVARVTRIGMEIAAVAADGAGGGRYDHMKDLDWEFAVIENSVPNAFVVPGGKVVVQTGLLQLLGDNDAELAAVLAHEVGHVLARHPAERISTLNAWSLANMLLRLFFGIGIPGIAMYMGIFLPYSRLAELEADLIGLRLMARACYHPFAAPSMLAKLNAQEKRMEKAGIMTSIPLFLRTHPLTEDRVAAVRSELQEAGKMYEQAGCGQRRDAFARAFITIEDLLNASEELARY